jgi:hypothetical protein
MLHVKDIKKEKNTNKLLKIKQTYVKIIKRGSEQKKLKYRI